MMIWIAIILGLTQGLCEFLPVSSSGHLVLLHAIFGIEEGAMFFTVMLHLGTLIAVFAVYWRQIWEIICSVGQFLKLLFTGRFKELKAYMRTPIQKKIGLLIAATVITTLMAVIFKDFFTEAFKGAFLGIGFLFTSAVLLMMNSFKKHGSRRSALRIPGAIGVGFMQGIAILPGVSRSGSTIAGATFFGLKKQEAAEFSFLLSIPAILGSLILQVPDIVETGISNIEWTPVIIGMAAAAVSGYLAIKLMIRLVVKNSLNTFAIYTALLGILVLLDQFVFNRFFTNPFWS